MVPHVEEFSADLEVAFPLPVEPEILEERETPIVAARASNEVAGRIAPLAGCRRREDGGIEPLVDGVRVMTGSAPVRTVQVRSVTGNQIAMPQRYLRRLQARGNKLMLFGVEPPVRRVLERTGLMEVIGEECVFTASPSIGGSSQEASDVKPLFLRPGRITDYSRLLHQYGRNRDHFP